MVDLAPFFFFAFLAAIILVPKYLRHQERGRLHETLRLAFERGQPVPPELVEALQVGRRPRAYDEPVYTVPDRPQRDLRRGVLWLAVGLGLVAVGGAFYAGLYNVGGSEETFGSFAAIGAIPAFIGVAYLGLWFFGRGRTKV
ncbi:DUF6249 domain-containing protein [Caulobacter sp. S45]|jgi:hypothetical protein|uniref:DUF6249 domain-containing protein n=1 Tax=Caulobacter sp. S45 TaxID=1641861 RepID=UPI00131B9571|nr:DUF6249 domain-containing protein [Caulobacter sp. S45]